MDYLQSHCPDTVVVVITGFASTESAITALRKGAYDYLTKPLDVDLVQCVVARALEKAHLHKDLQRSLTQLKAREEQLLKAHDELARRVEAYTAANTMLERAIAERTQTEETLRRTAEELARSNADLQEFAYVASHDLQEPLRMVTSYVQLLAKRYQGQLDAEAHQFISFAVEGAQRMRVLLHDLLTYSRIGTGEQTVAPADCETILAQTLGNLRMAIAESTAEVTHDPLPTLLTDAVQLGQVFQNLLGNALKFRGQEPPRIHIAARQDGNRWVFSVRDNGIGIDPQYAERIFAVFQRLHTRREYSGSGIGLAICKKVVEHHGGRIWVESEFGKGATFFFTLPVS
jgi:light-regulated signal transduction histidine kinase (bacteriophytochrome)